MPKVKCYSAAWLSKNAPGNQLFEPSPDGIRSRALSPAYTSKKKQVAGPRRTIARRGTEFFIAVGKEIRWGDLVYLKEEWSEKQARKRHSQSPHIKREDSLLSTIEHGDHESAGGLRVCANQPAFIVSQMLTC